MQSTLVLLSNSWYSQRSSLKNRFYGVQRIESLIIATISSKALYLNCIVTDFRRISIMIKFIKAICIIAILTLAVLLVPGSLAYSNYMLFQTSPISALQQGVFDGNMTFKDLRAHGDFGL
jgi:hypothetical protein